MGVPDSNNKNKLVLIGAGSIATEVIARLPENIVLTHIITTTKSLKKTQDKYPNVIVVDNASEIKETPDYVIECAGHDAVRNHGKDIISKGWDLYVISTGVFADEEFYHDLKSLSYQNGSQLQLLCGAIAGMDGLKAVKHLHKNPNPVSVTYRSIKPIKGWFGTYAEQLINLNQITQRTCFFEGSAKEAAILFPQNANVAATIALNGIGFTETKVSLNACPDSSTNKHLIDIKGDFGEITLSISGYPLPSNPKTSFLTALSIIQILEG